jgi:hypothetical protein
MRNSRFLAQEACLHAELDFGRSGAAMSCIFVLISTQLRVHQTKQQEATIWQHSNHMTKVFGSYLILPAKF